MQIRRIAKGCFPKNMSLEMVSGVHRTDFNWPVLAGTKFLPALFFFFFLTFNAQKMLSEIILGQADLTGKPEVHQLFGLLHSCLSKMIPRASGIPVIS